MIPVAYRGSANYEPESWQIELLLIWAKKFELIVIGFKSCPAASSRKTQKKSLLLTTHTNPRSAVIGGTCWDPPSVLVKTKELLLSATLLKMTACGIGAEQLVLPQ